MGSLILYINVSATRLELIEIEYSLSSSWWYYCEATRKNNFIVKLKFKSKLTLKGGNMQLSLTDFFSFRCSTPIVYQKVCTHPVKPFASMIPDSSYSRTAEHTYWNYTLICQDLPVGKDCESVNQLEENQNQNIHQTSYKNKFCFFKRKRSFLYNKWAVFFFILE